MNRLNALRPAARARSFGHAFRGWAAVLRTQPNTWIHALATGTVLSAAGWYDVTRVEWMALVLTVAAVWTAEFFNSALEFLADAVHPDPHPLVGRAKDAAAGAVLVTAFASVVVGFLIFGPRLLGT